jgi:hypothetical protein
MGYRQLFSIRKSGKFIANFLRRLAKNILSLDKVCDKWAAAGGGCFNFKNQVTCRWHTTCGGLDETVSLLFSFFPAFFIAYRLALFFSLQTKKKRRPSRHLRRKSRRHSNFDVNRRSLNHVTVR